MSQQQETKPPPLPSSSSPPWAWIKCLRDMTDPLKNENQSHNNNIKEVELPVQILPWLFLSDRKNAMNISKLQQNNITHILSVHGMSPNEIKYYQERLDGTNIIHKQINCDDTEGYDMIGKHWMTCYEFLKTVRESSPDDGKVVVHCVAGINRSGLIVCCAQMIFEQQLLLDVVQHCLKQRGGSLLWNRSFQRQLCDLAQDHGLLGPKPPDYNDEPLIEKLPPPPPAHHITIDNMQSAKRSLVSHLHARLNFDDVLAATKNQQQQQQSSSQQQQEKI